MCPNRTTTLFSVVLGIECQSPSAPKLGDMGAYALGGSHKSWDARYDNKLLPRGSWQLGLTVGVSQREK